MGLRSLFSEADETNGDVIPQRQFGGSDVSAGAELGLRGMQSAGYELINDPAGAAYARAQAAGVPVRFRSSDDVDWTSPSDIVDYAQQQAGQFAPSGALSLAGAGLGAGLSRTIMGAAAENLTRAQLAERAASMATGARVGSTIASGAQQYGDMAGELRAQGKEPGAGTVGLAALGGLSETFALENLFKGLVASAGKDAIEAGVKSTLASRALQGAAAGIGKAQLTEVPTEVFQEGLAIANRSLYDPAYRENTDDMWRRTKETAIATAAGAGLAGVGPGAIGGLRSAPGSTPEVTPEVESTTDAAQPNKPILGLPHHNPDDFIVMPDGSTARRSEIDWAIKEAENDQDPAKAEYLRNALRQFELAADDMLHRDRQEAEARRRTPGLMAANTPPALPAPNSTVTTSTYDPYTKQSTDRFGLPTPSTSPGDTNGESQNATQESALPNETGKRQEVLEPAGARAPAPVSSRAQKAFEYFQGKGLPAHTAAGIVGALTGESSRQLSPGIVNPSSGAFGIAQWLGSRVRELDAFAKQRGKPIDDFDTQLDFVWHELNNKEAGAFAHVKNAPDAVTASDLFTTKFERPGKHELRLEPRRAAALDLLSGKPVGTTAAQMEAGPPNGLPRRGIDETPDERAERIRRSIAGENQYQDTRLGRAYKTGQTYADNEQTKQTYADEGLQFEDTDDGFSLTFKGRKRESTGEDLMDTGRSRNSATEEDDIYEGLTPHSTSVRAFQQVFPNAQVQISGEGTPNFERQVSVKFDNPERDITDTGEKYRARAMLEAFHSGKEDALENKIMLQHQSVLSEDKKSKNYGKPIEIPITKSGLAKIGRSLDPALDDTPQASHAAAISGLTHLIYDHGFEPRGVDIKKLEDAITWIKEQLGEAPKDRTPERAEPVVEDREIQGRKVGSARMEGQLPTTDIQLEDRPELEERESPELRTPMQQKLMQVLGEKVSRLLADPKFVPKPKGDTPEAKHNYRRAAAVNQAARSINPAEINVWAESMPVGVTKTGENKGKPEMVMQGMKPVGGHPDVDRLLSGKIFATKEEAARARDDALRTVAEEKAYEAVQRLARAQKKRRDDAISDEVARQRGGLVNGKLVRAKVNVFPESSEALRQRLTDEGYGANDFEERQARQRLHDKVYGMFARDGRVGYKLRELKGGKGFQVVPELRRPQTATAEDVAQAAELLKRDYSGERYRQSLAKERDALSLEAGRNVEFMPLSDELSEDQLLATEAEAGIADDRAAMARRTESLGPAVDRSLKWRGIQGVSSDINNTLDKQSQKPPGHNDPGPAKTAVRKRVANNTKELEKAGQVRHIEHKDIETLHDVPGGSTIRASGVSEQVVDFFKTALADIGLQVPLRVSSKTMVDAHLDALEAETGALDARVSELSAQLKEMTTTKAEKTQLQKELKQAERDLADASHEYVTLQKAKKEDYKARVIYNDHYRDPSKRTPIVVVRDDLMEGEGLSKLLSHELGHLVQRAWFDALPAEQQQGVLKELSQDGAYTDDVPEAFADAFMNWYEHQKRAQRIKQKQKDYASNPLMAKVFGRLLGALRRLYDNLRVWDRAFRTQYPELSGFLNAVVGFHKKLEPISPEINDLWRSSLSHPYGGLPLRVAKGKDYHDMSPEDTPSITIKGAGSFPDLYAAERAGVFSPAEVLVLRELNEYDGFGNDNEAEALRELLDAVQENDGEFLTEGDPEEMLKALKGLIDKVSYSKGSLRFAAGPLAQKGAEQLGRFLWDQHAHQTSASDVLRFYVDSGEDSFYRGLAKSLLDVPAIAKVLVKAGGAPKTGQWNPSLAQVNLDFNERRGVLTGNAGWHALFHELVHAATLAAYDDDAAAAAEITRLYEIAKTEAKNKGREFYGLKNPAEFMAELKTNPEFQDFLAATHEKKGGASLFSRFISWLRRALKFKGPVSVLERAVAVTDKLIDASKERQDLRSFGDPTFHHMTVDEFNQTVTDAAKQRLDQAQKWASGKPIAQKQVTKDYIARANATLDVLKTGARWLLKAEGDRLRGSFGGLFAGWGNVYAPEMGVERKLARVIDGPLRTNAITGTLRNHTHRIEAKYRVQKENLIERTQNLSKEQTAALRELLRDERPLLEILRERGSQDSPLSRVKDEELRPVANLARDIRSYFWLLRKGLVKAGVLEKEQLKSNYSPKMWGADKFADLKMRDEIISRITKLYEAREELPVQSRERLRVEDAEGNLIRYSWHEKRYTSAKMAATDFYNRIRTGELDAMVDQSSEAIERGLLTSAFAYNKPRPFSEAEYKQFKLYDFLEDDVGYMVNNYTVQAAKRIAQMEATGIPRQDLANKGVRERWETRFLNAGVDTQVMYTPTAALDLLLAEGVQDGRISTKEEYNEAKSLLTSSLGMKNVGSNPMARRWVNRIVAFQTFLTMPWSAFAALADFGVTAWRGESFERMTEALGKTFNSLTREKELELLRTLGMAMGEASRSALTSETIMANDPMARGTHRATEWFFHWNGMEYLSRTNMIFASALGQSYIKDYANQAVNGKTEKERADAVKRLRMLHPTLTPHQALTEDFHNSDDMQVALSEFINQAHLHDQHGYTPEIFNDYRFRFFTMLKGFSFKFHNIVLKQLREKMKDQPDLLRAAVPMVTLAAATMPLALAGMWLKDRLRRDLPSAAGHMIGTNAFDLKRAKDKTPAQILHDVVMASGMPGVYLSLFDDMLEAPQHGQPGLIAIMGPVVGSAYNFSARTLDESVPAMIPGVASVPGFRAAMRSGLRNTFGFGVRDEEE